MIAFNLLNRARGPSLLGAIVLACMYILIPCDTLHAQSVLKAQRGITATYQFQYAGPELRAKIQRETDAPIVVRLQRGQAKSEYEARFIGNSSGRYDLRDWLEHVDGSPIAASQPYTVEVVSTLPNDPRSDLFEVDIFQTRLNGGYRIGLILACLAWLAIPLTILVRRLVAQPQAVVVQAVAPSPTLAEQLQPLIEAAARGELSTADKARFELLLVHYFREQASLPDLDMATSIQQLRTHATAGPIIAAVEQWLHASATSAENSVERPSQTVVLPERESIHRVLSLLDQLPTMTAPHRATTTGSETS